MQGRKSLTAALLLLPLLSATSQSKNSSNNPAFVRLSLAGSNLADELGFVKYDAKARYYLIATGDCDGASVDLILTPNPSKYGFDADDPEAIKSRNIKRVTLPRLRNGKGINIGETPQEVRKKLGAAPHRVNIRKDLGGQEWHYYASIFMKSRQARGMQNYRATYTFRQGKLWSIAYNVQERDGCD